MISIRYAAIDDFEFFYEIKCEENNIFWTGHDDKPLREELFSFFQTAVKESSQKEKRKIYIVENGKLKIGYLYIIPNGNSFELSSAISQKFQGKGYGKKAIALGLEEGKALGYRKMIGSIREDNIASMKAHIACGVRVTEDYNLVYIPKLNRKVKMYIIEKNLEED